MKLNQLIKIKAKEKKRIGRGIGSGKGKTAGRGSKGQKARGKIPQTFTGGGLPLYKKLPLRRGQGNPKLSPKPILINLSRLDVFKAGATVDIQSLLDEGIIKKEDVLEGVKILSGGEINKKLIVKVPVSNAVQKIIERAKGKVEWIR